MSPIIDHEMRFSRIMLMQNMFLGIWLIKLEHNILHCGLFRDTNGSYGTKETVVVKA